MANMAYCRFQNTLRDLEDCYDFLDKETNPLSEDEERARERLIRLCRTIARDYDGVEEWSGREDEKED